MTIDELIELIRGRAENLELGYIVLNSTAEIAGGPVKGADGEVWLDRRAVGLTDTVTIVWSHRPDPE